MKVHTISLLIFIFGFILNCLPRFTYAYSTNMSASVVIGQTNMTNSSANAGGSISDSGFEYPYGALIIGNKLLINDYYNYRILIYNSIPSSNNAAADVVIGQADMTTNTTGTAANKFNGVGGMATDGTKLFVSDFGNNRVLVFNSVPTTNNASADMVIGQPNLSTTSSGTTDKKLNQPWGVDYDSSSGKLLITDYGNNRILIYNSVPASDNASADVVVGQSNFTSGTANQGGTVNSNTLNLPYYARIFNSKLFIADTDNNRVLIFNTVPATNNASADVVVGQTTMTNGSAGSLAATSLAQPSDVYLQNGELFINDAWTRRRVLIFDGVPTSNGAAAYKVIGQENFTSNTSGVTANKVGLSDSFMGFNDSSFIFSDGENNRVLIFIDDSITPTPTPTTTSTPSPTATPGSSQSSNSGNSVSSSKPNPPTCSDSEPGVIPDLFQINSIKNSATLYFTTANTPVTYHYISYGFQPNAEQFGIQFPLGFSSGVESYTIKSLSPNTPYYFKIRGGNGCKPGKWSRVLKVVTPKKTSLQTYIYYAYTNIVNKITSFISQ